MPSPPELPSFKELHREYLNFVWSTVRRFGTAPSEMEDVIQEVFMVIHSRLHTLQKPESLRSWIYGVVRRVASSHRRTVRSNEPVHPGASLFREALSLEPTPFEQTERSNAVRLLMSLLETLDEQKRELFALVEIEELSVPEAAEILDVPLNTAYSRLRSARHQFDLALARHEARNKER